MNIEAHVAPAAALRRPRFQGAPLETALRLDGARWLLVNVFGDDQVARLEPFDAIEIDLLDVWGESRAAK